LALGLVVCLAVAAALASGAQAALQWTVGEPSKALSSETINAFTNPGDIPWEFSTEIGGAIVDLTDEGVSCSGKCTVSGEGKSKLKLTFTKVTLASAIGKCEVKGGTFTTSALKGQVFMDSLFPTSVFDKVEPSEGSVFFVFELTGKPCALSGKYEVKGSLVGEATNPTGGLTPDWMMRFRPEVQELVAPEGGLKLGSSQVKAQGYTHNELIGANKGAKWGIME
jgi:hypothetical protein